LVYYWEKSSLYVHANASWCLMGKVKTAFSISCALLLLLTHVT